MKDEEMEGGVVLFVMWCTLFFGECAGKALLSVWDVQYRMRAGGS